MDLPARGEHTRDDGGVAIETRLKLDGLCDGGHRLVTLDLVLDGRTVGAVLVHADGRDDWNLYIEPPGLREAIERDHLLLHRVGFAAADALRALDRCEGAAP